jgi:hypothetical protein
MSRIIEVLDLIEPVLERLYNYVEHKVDTETLDSNDKTLEVMMFQFSALNLEFAELAQDINNRDDYQECLARYQNVNSKFTLMTENVLAYIGE